MGSRKVPTYLIVLLILGSGLAVDQLAFDGQVLDGFLGLFGLGSIGGNVYNGQVAPLKMTPYKEGTTTAITSVECYAWFDWDGDGAVDLGEYGSGGEIETLTGDGSSGLITTNVAYPVGGEVWFQLHSSSYEVLQVKRVVASVPAGYDGDAIAVPNAFMILTDTGTSRVLVGQELLVSGSTDYNYTLSGSEPTLSFRHTATSTDAGISSPQYTHWGTGKSYSGSIVVATFTNQDFIDLKPAGYDGVHIGASTTTIWWFVDGYFNDADVTGDEVFSLQFTMDITGDGDIATIGMYSDVEMGDLAIGVLNTQIGTYEDNLDFVA